VLEAGASRLCGGAAVASRAPTRTVHLRQTLPATGMARGGDVSLRKTPHRAHRAQGGPSEASADSRRICSNGPRARARQKLTWSSVHRPKARARKPLRDLLEATDTLELATAEPACVDLDGAKDVAQDRGGARSRTALLRARTTQKPGRKTERGASTRMSSAAIAICNRDRIPHPAACETAAGRTSRLTPQASPQRRSCARRLPSHRKVRRHTRKARQCSHRPYVPGRVDSARLAGPRRPSSCSQNWTESDGGCRMAPQGRATSPADAG
jgi:hypothetical protein